MGKDLKISLPCVRAILSYSATSPILRHPLQRQLLMAAGSNVNNIGVT